MKQKIIKKSFSSLTAFIQTEEKSSIVLFTQGILPHIILISKWYDSDYITLIWINFHCILIWFQYHSDMKNTSYEHHMCQNCLMYVMLTWNPK